MTDLLEMILAARRKGDGGWVQLLIPIVVVLIYVASGLAKMKMGARDEDIELEKRPNLRDTEGKLRYKSLDEAGARERPAAPRSVQPRAKQLPYAKPSAQPAAQRPAPWQPRQPAEPGPAARRPQPMVQPRPARIPSHLRPQEAPPVRPRPAPAAARPRTKPKRHEPIPASRDAQKLRKPQKVAANETKPPPDQVIRKRTTLRADLSGSSNLQRAIIYSEILGKPLALRDM